MKGGRANFRKEGSTTLNQRLACNTQCHSQKKNTLQNVFQYKSGITHTPHSTMRLITKQQCDRTHFENISYHSNLHIHINTVLFGFFYQLIFMFVQGLTKLTFFTFILQFYFTGQTKSKLKYTTVWTE